MLHLYNDLTVVRNMMICFISLISLQWSWTTETCFTSNILPMNMDMMTTFDSIMYPYNAHKHNIVFPLYKAFSMIINEFYNELIMVTEIIYFCKTFINVMTMMTCFRSIMPFHWKSKMKYWFMSLRCARIF